MPFYRRLFSLRFFLNVIDVIERDFGAITLAGSLTVCFYSHF